MFDGPLSKINFPGISSRAWEHPADRAALVALKQIPALDVLLQNILSLLGERSWRLLYLSSSVRTSGKQFPRLHYHLKQACEILDSHYVPELYITENPYINAGAIGVDKPFIVLNSAAVQKLEADENLAIIGHELGHCLSGHALYHTLLIILTLFSRYLLDTLNIPLAGLAIEALIYAIMEWYRQSELSADRAGLLTVQDPNVSYRLLMKMAGGTMIEQMDINEFFNQAREFEKSGDLVDVLHKVFLEKDKTHPFPVVRLTKLKAWVDSGDYQKILDGDYQKKENDNQEDPLKNFQEAQKQAREEAKARESDFQQAVNKTAQDIGKGINQASEEIGRFFSGLFKNQDDDKK
ncbi:MAG: M48 family metallopeptidase [Spirochaetales bacterium]|nr:M48 family metallopeptidase [Spirochaetales bacterium]